MQQISLLLCKKKKKSENAVKIITLIIKGCHGKMLKDIPLLKEHFTAILVKIKSGNSSLWSIF